MESALRILKLAIEMERQIQPGTLDDEAQTAMTKFEELISLTS
jgi:hypothetical protein